MKPRNDPRWWALKDWIKQRAGFVCEYCRKRGIEDLHHRTYAREGQENVEDLMGVCRACHRAIHSGSVGLVVSDDSIANLGDSGLGIDGVVWQNYLNKCRGILGRPLIARLRTKG